MTRPFGIRAQRSRATPCLSSPARESSTPCHAQKVRITPPPCLALLNRRMSTMACRATSYSGGVRIIQKHAEQRPMGGVWKYCMSNVLFGRGSNHFNALCGRGFGEYIVTLVKLRKGCLRQACSTPDTTFVSLPTGEETCNLHTPLTTHSKGQGSPAPAANGGGCYASAPAAAPACSIAASCCGSVAVDASAFRLRLRVCLAIAARFAEDILLTI